MITRRTAFAALAATTLPASISLAQDDAVEVKEMVSGNPDSTVTVTEYASFTCPHCAAFTPTPTRN